MINERLAGVLMPISSLASDYGIGTLGEQAKQFVDFLVLAKQSYWQILPLSETGYGDSPYQSISAFAGNPYLIDLDYLTADGLLNKEDYENIEWSTSKEKVDYEKLYFHRYEVLRIASDNFFAKNHLKDYKKFVKNNPWVDDYALFKTLKAIQNNVGLLDFELKYRIKDDEAINEVKKNYKQDIEFYKSIQYFFFKQWFNLKEYANSKGIKIIGDCPLYVSCDSCDVWSNPELFKVDKELIPKNVAGTAPDYFSVSGQLWGNPLYDWKKQKEDDFAWWRKRIKHLCSIYDYVRIDHFRGLASYYSIKYGSPNASNGKWVKGPGKKIIDALKREVGEQIIAEDLGLIDDEVRKLLAYSTFPGMAVIEFGFDNINDPNNINFPANFKENLVAYAGTHDNTTINGWLNAIDAWKKDYVLDYFGYTDGKQFNWLVLEKLFESKANTVIALAQDLLGLDESARINTPGTLGDNWTWRAKGGVFTPALAKKLATLTKKYQRI